MPENKRLGWNEFIDHQVSKGLLSEDSPSPENDPRVLRAFLALVKNESPQEEEAEIAVLADRYGFFLDKIDSGRDGANFAGLTSIMDFCLGISYDDLVGDLPAIREQAEETLLTDTFSLSDGYGRGGEVHEGLVWVNSPVAAVDTSFEIYLESLTTERRKKYRRSVSDFEKTNLRFALSDESLGKADMEFIRKNLAKKWGEDADYAFRQPLWSLAVQTVRPSQSLVMRVFDGDRLTFIQTMIVKSQTVLCQSIAKDEETFYNGLASFTDFQCVKALCGQNDYAIFDPTCRSALDEPESIGVAKRATVNRNCMKPVLAMGERLPPEIRAMIETGQVQGKEA